MLTHTTLEAVLPSRVVILGASGVIGQALTSYLAHRDVSIAAVGSSELDLLDSDAPARLAKLLHYDDALVVLACIPPRRGRDLATMLQNVRMGINICAALSRQPVAHAIYVSSDAVYPRFIEEVNEATVLSSRQTLIRRCILSERTCFVV